MNTNDTENRIAQAKQMFQGVFPDPKGILDTVDVYVVDGKRWLGAVRESDARCKSTQSSETDIASLQAAAFQDGEKVWILLRKSVMRGNAAFHIVLWHELAHIYAAHYECQNSSLFQHCKTVCDAETHSDEDLIFFRGYQLWGELIAQSMAFLLCEKYNMKPSGDALYEIQGQLTRAMYSAEFDYYALGRFYGQLLFDRRLVKFRRNYFRNLNLADYKEFDELVEGLENVQRLLADQLSKERFWEISYDEVLVLGMLGTGIEQLSACVPL